MRSVRAWGLWSVLLSSGLVVGCADEMPTEAAAGDVREVLAELSTESTCGASWDLQDVESYNGALGTPTYFVAQHERRVGFHATIGCTGTLISDDLFISAGHCTYSVGDVVRFDFQNDAAGTARTTRDFTVGAIVEQEWTSTWDYAIVRLNGNPGREFGHASIAAVDPPAGSQVTIIQHPALQRKQIHAGPVLDYSSAQGTNWFRHQVDTTGGSSGSGVLNADGQLVGIHTNAGCSMGTPIEGNSAMRMSQLVPHSPTLQALTRSKILWQNSGDGRASIWSLDANGTHLTYAETGPLSGWTPISFSNNRVLWRHYLGRISYWTLNDLGQHLTYAESGPFDGWTAVNHANDRIMWRHTSGKISLWTVNSVGNYLSHVEHGPFPGWTAVNYANNRILWRHDSGKISMWTLDDAGNHLTYAESGPFAGWTAQSYANGQILWKHTDGRTSLWTVDRVGNILSYAENGPHGGWDAIANVDRKQLWRHVSGKISYWTTNSVGNYLNHVEHGPFAGWTALFTTGGAP